MQAACARRAAVPGVGIVLALALTACSGGGFEDSGGSGSKQGGQVRLLVNITPNLTRSFWEGLVKPFEDSTGVDVSIEAPTGKGVSDTLQQQLAAGDEPDVVETLMPDPKLAPQLTELTDQVWAKDTPLVQEAALGGKVYAVGVGEQAQSLVFYNKEAFAKAGITQPPRTLDEMTADMAKLKAAGYLPLQTAGDFVTGLQLLQLTDPSLNQMNKTWYADVAAGRTTVGKLMLPYLKRYQSWLKKGYVDKNALGLKNADGETQFLSGKSAMYVMGSWFVASANTAGSSAPDLGVFPAPVESGEQSPGPQGATMAAPYMVMKSSKHRADDLKLVKWLVTDKNAVNKQLAQDGDFRAGSDRKMSPLEQAIQKILDSAPAKVAQGEGYGDNRLPAGFNAAWNTRVQGLYVGRSPKTVASSVDSWVASHADKG